MKRAYALPLVLVSLLGCARPPQSDDILRLRPEFAPQWRDALRDSLYGYFLRGTALELWLRPTEQGTPDTVVVFRLEREGEEEVLTIPVAHLQNVARRFRLDTSRYGGWDFVETYAVTQHIPTVHRIPVRFRPCDCLPLGLRLPSLRLQCPQRRLGWYLLELRGVATAYSDAPTRTSRQGQLRYTGELTAGVRLGSHRQWAAGLTYSLGTPVYNSFRNELLRRPLTLLYLRYQLGNERIQAQRTRLVIDPRAGPMSLPETALGTSTTTEAVAGCIRPFLYANLGMSLDRLTLRMARFWLSQKQGCSECVRFLRDLEASGRLPEVDFSLPISWGIGIGVEMTLTPWADLGIDLGWRSLAIGEETSLLGFQNVPSNRRLNMLMLRAGLTF